jgi:hypothetical protein
MAKVSASASASGQAADAVLDPQFATAPAKTTRATRGQSREPQQQQTQRRSARNASVESEITSPAKIVSNIAETGTCKNTFLENNPIPLPYQYNPTNPGAHLHFDAAITIFFRDGDEDMLVDVVALCIAIGLQSQCTKVLIMARVL